jgi:hypothetical protein
LGVLCAAQLYDLLAIPSGTSAYFDVPSLFISSDSFSAAAFTTSFAALAPVIVSTMKSVAIFLPADVL